MSEIENKEVATAPVEAAVETVKEEAPKAEKKSSVLNASVKPEDFDWDAFEGGDVYGDTDRKAIEEAYDKTLSKVVENEVVEGEITGLNKREVVVTIGGKSEGVIPVSEFRYDPDLKVGDKVEVYVESAEDKKGQLVLSHRKARTLKSWDRVNEAFENDEIVKGYYFIGGEKTEAGISRIVAVSPKILPYVQSWLKPGYIFSEDGSRKVQQKKFRNEWYYPALDAAGVRRLVPHCCRHTFATLMKEVDAPDADKAAMIGHTKIDMTYKYTHTDVKSSSNIAQKI